MIPWDEDQLQARMSRVYLGISHSDMVAETNHQFCLEPERMSKHVQLQRLESFFALPDVENEAWTERLRAICIAEVASRS